MHRKDRTAAGIAICIVTLGSVMTCLFLVSARIAHHRAYVEIATSCRKASLVTVDSSRFFCAPVARVEMATRVEPGQVESGNAGAGRAGAKRAKPPATTPL